MKQSPQRMDIEGGSISEKARQWLYSFQEGKCAICGSPEKLIPDFDTKSGELRGLICKKCNVQIGRIERRGSVSINNPSYNQIRDYLSNHPAKRAKLVCLVQFKKGIVEHGWEKTSLGVYILSLPDYLEPHEFLDTVPKTLSLVETLR